MLTRVFKQLFARGQGAAEIQTGAHASAQVLPAGASTPAGATPNRRIVDFSVTETEMPDFWQRAHAPLQDLTIIVPILPGRGTFLKTLLEHFSLSRIGCQIIMTVNSDASHEPEVERLVTAYPTLRVEVLYHAMSVHFVDRLNECARRARTEYVFVHSDDDFVIAGALADCVDFLNANADYVACQGRSFFFAIRNETGLSPSPQRFVTRSESSDVARVLEHCRHYSNTFHAVTRREAFLESNEKTMVHTQQVIFWQYLASCWLISLGKLKVLDRLYYMRLDNPRGERAMLVKRADRRHWPYLIVAPDFSSEQERFKLGLIAALKGRAPDDQLGDVADECCLGLIRRAFGAPMAFDRAELEMHARFFESSSNEAQIACYCGPRSRECLRSLAPAAPVAPVPTEEQPAS